MEDLWKSLSADLTKMESPAWHGDALRDTEQRYRVGKNSQSIGPRRSENCAYTANEECGSGQRGCAPCGACSTAGRIRQEQRALSNEPATLAMFHFLPVGHAAGPRRGYRYLSRIPVDGRSAA
jgi:hypothetical protein